MDRLHAVVRPAEIGPVRPSRAASHRPAVPSLLGPNVPGRRSSGLRAKPPNIRADALRTSPRSLRLRPPVARGGPSRVLSSFRRYLLGPQLALWGACGSARPRLTHSRAASFLSPAVYTCPECVAASLRRPITCVLLHPPKLRLDVKGRVQQNESYPPAVNSWHPTASTSGCGCGLRFAASRRSPRHPCRGRRRPFGTIGR